MDLRKAAKVWEVVFLSNWGWATRLKSPPMYICVEKYLFRVFKKVAKKEACATLGAYTFAIVISLPAINSLMIRNLLSGSL